jgi:hypothetical protein
MSNINTKENQSYRGIIDYLPPDFKPAEGNNIYCFAGVHLATKAEFRCRMRVFETARPPSLEQFSAWVTSQHGSAPGVLKTFAPDHNAGVFYYYRNGGWTALSTDQIKEIEKYRRPRPAPNNAPDLGPLL